MSTNHELHKEIWLEEREIRNRIVQALIWSNGGNLNGYGGSDVDGICRRVMSRMSRTAKPNLPPDMECFCTFIGDCGCDRQVDVYDARGLGDLLKSEIKLRREFGN